MVARLSIYENVDLDLADRVEQWMKASGGSRSPGFRAIAPALEMPAESVGIYDIVHRD